MIPVFFCEPSSDVQLWLRRYRSSAEHKCRATGSYCNGMVPFGRAPARMGASNGHQVLLMPEGEPPTSDPRWPVTCDACGEVFTADDTYQLFRDRIYRAADGREWPKRELPPGACYDATWLHDFRLGPDGRSLMVVCPDGHEWFIDNEASNCTMKGEPTHRCWVRHGKPEDGTLHVDKNGHTCAAGGGSIDTGKWHGFLHHGHLKT
jgi:hypothetical protein